MRRELSVLKARPLRLEQIERRDVEGGVSMSRGRHIPENSAWGVEIGSGKFRVVVTARYGYQCEKSRDYATIPDRDTWSAARAPPIECSPVAHHAQET